MVISHETIEAIDEQTLKGFPIGYYGKDDDMSLIPRMLGDWNIRAIEEKRTPGTGYIVAVPSNGRTRLIYTKGRIAWLVGLGFNPDLANAYVHSSGTITRRWDHEVALFVLNNAHMDDFVLDLMLSATNPKRAGERNNIHTRSSRGKVLSGCQILKSMRVSGK
jgi:hypothetical protein